MLTVGNIVVYEQRLWRVGLVNDSRCRLDPVSGSAQTVHGVEFTAYGTSCNVSPGSPLQVVAQTELTAEQHQRAQKLATRIDLVFMTTSMHKESEMAEVEEAVAAPAPKITLKKPVNGATPLGTAPKAAAAKVPVKAAAGVAQPTVSANKTANKERVAALAAKKDAKPRTAPKAGKTTKPCACGCGDQVAGYFAQGHDARFKGWMTKVEQGTMRVEDLPKAVQKSTEFKKKGAGYVSLTNYKGEKHTGYSKPTV